MEEIFFIISGIAVGATIMAVTRLNAVHALLYLIVSLLAVSILMFIIGAPFAGILEVIIYAGAIMVLFIFIIMMLNLGRESTDGERRLLRPGVWIGPLALCLILAALFTFILWRGDGVPHDAGVIPAKKVGISLFSTYLPGVEFAGLLLTAGIIGAYHLGGTKRHTYHRFLKGGKQ